MSELRSMFLVFLGGGLGAILRYGISKWSIVHIPFDGVWATCLINLSSCLLLGIFAGLCHRSEGIFAASSLFLITGFCGGYSTFSTFSAEVFHQFQAGQFIQAILYLSISVIGGIVVFWAAYSLTR